jgi:hypothetical protein
MLSLAPLLMVIPGWEFLDDVLGGTADVMRRFALAESKSGLRVKTIVQNDYFGRVRPAVGPGPITLRWRRWQRPILRQCASVTAWSLVPSLSASGGEGRR